MKRKITHVMQGFPTVDGGGVSLTRVLGNSTVDQFDPILMLDSFDSVNPDDYIAGFPLHPHRGIETISLIVHGNMEHKDSLGNSASISNGEVQWMCAGSGILHEEHLPASEYLLGVQLWLNLPKKDKMTTPFYHSIHKKDIKEINLNGATVRLIAGNFKGVLGFQSSHLPLDYYHILIEPNQSITIDMEQSKSVMVFTLVGDAIIAKEEVKEKNAVKLSEGTSLTIKAKDTPIQVLYLSSNRLDEPVSWGGPIVMNTKEELNQAFQELQNGTFLKQQTQYDE